MSKRKAHTSHRNRAIGSTAGKKTLALAAAAGAALLILAVGTYLIFAPDDPATGAGGNAATEAPFKVLDPKAGSLVVGETEVRQLAGRCLDTQVCEYDSPETLPTVKVAKGTESLPLAAETTEPYSVSISATDSNVDASKVRVAAVEGRLLLTKLPAGTYRVSLKAGKAAWQFDLQMMKK